MSRELDRQYIARDAYSSWKKRVQGAQHAIRVFTPYLDSMLDRLLQNSGLAESAKSVVTDLSPASGALDFRGQLIGVRALLRRGVGVRSLPRLHAKVLLCDGELATIGSQNFTSYARHSKETTFASEDGLENSSMLRTLDEWFNAATPVDLDLVEVLLSDLGTEAQAAAESQKLLVAAFDRIWSSREDDNMDPRSNSPRATIASRLSAALRVSHERHARSDIWARLEEVDGWGIYETLLADRNSDFTQWRTRSDDGSLGVTRLDRLSFYPFILNPNGRMGFARVAKTRITYVRETVVWNRPRVIAGQQYKVRTHLPRLGVEESNVHLTLQPSRSSDSRGLLLRARFDGSEVALSSYEVLRDARFDEAPAWFNAADWDPEELGRQLAEPAALSRVLDDIFAPFSFTELDRDKHDAASFFPGGWLRVTLIDFASRHILVGSRQ